MHGVRTPEAVFVTVSCLCFLLLLLFSSLCDIIYLGYTAQRACADCAVRFFVRLAKFDAGVSPDAGRWRLAARGADRQTLLAQVKENLVKMTE